MICTAEALVLRGYRMTESSKVVILYSREKGKLRMAARGARRPKSKFGASLEPITLGHYVFSYRENRELQTLTEGDIRYSFEGIKGHYQRMVTASVVCELLDHMTEDEDRNPMLFGIAVDALRWLESVPEHALELPLWYFQLKGAAALGYRPHLSGCIRCGKRIAGERIRFNPYQGGTLCEVCESGGILVRRSSIACLEEIQVKNPDQISVSGYENANQNEINGLLRTFLEHHIESGRKVRSIAFMDQMMAAEKAPIPYRTRDAGVNSDAE